jgi:UDP-glucose 6-dehydrogenase
VRESVSLKLLKLLSGQVKSLSAHDPIATVNATKAMGADANIDFVENWEIALARVDIIIIATSWLEYSDLTKMTDKIGGKIVFDTRSLLTKTDFPENPYLTVN